MVSAGSEERLERRIALNSWTLDTTPLVGLLAVAEQAGYSAVELRAADFKRVADIGSAADAVRESGLKVASLGADGILVQASAGEQAEWFARLAETAALARRLGCGMLMVSTGMRNATTVAAASQLLAEAGDVAAGAGLSLAYEFNAFHPSIASLPDALTVVAAAGRANVGLALDAYHLQRSGGFGQLAAIDPAMLFTVQISDVPAPGGPAEPSLDRLPPGQGVTDWSRMFSWLDETGYTGFVAFEAPNPVLWQADARAVAAQGLRDITALWRTARRGPTGSGASR